MRRRSSLLSRCFFPPPLEGNDDHQVSRQSSRAASHYDVGRALYINEDSATNPALSPPRVSRVQKPNLIISLMGRQGSGKSSIVNAYSDDAWTDHPARRELLKPGMRLNVMNLARQTVAKALVSGQLVVDSWPPVVQSALGDLLRPLHPFSVRVDSLLVIHEYGVFKQLLPHDQCALTSDEGFLNAYTILVDEFPVSLFTEVDYVPTKREIALLRVPSLCMMEAYRKALHVRIVDCAGMRGNLRMTSALHSYAFEFPEISTPIFVAGLHDIESRVDQEQRAFLEVYNTAAQHNVAKIGVIFTQVDSLLNSRKLGMNVTDFKDKLCSVVETLIGGAFGNVVDAGDYPSLVIGVCCGLNVASASTGIHSLTQEKSWFSSPAKDLFLLEGIIPHRDVELSSMFKRSVYWSRSVFGHTEGKPKAPIYGLLSPMQRRVLETILLCSKRKESNLRALPNSLLLHIASFALGIGEIV